MNINMEHKNIVATIYLKDGKAIKARDNYEMMKINPIRMILYSAFAGLVLLY